MSQKRARSASPESSPIFRSSPIEDRSSKFIAFYSPTLPAKELQAHTEFKSASHRVAAWRKPSSQRSLNAQPVLEAAHDDDGEKYGGKALEKVLVEIDVEGAVVVARWYGGVLLGPVRFDHIRNCALDAITQWSQDRERSAKKAKLRDDEAERERLITNLSERDESITVLRGLLAERNQQSSPASGGKSSPAKVPNYASLPLATLQKLEQVRDATIGWILKQIEKAEESQAEKSEAAVSTAKAATEMPKVSPQTGLANPQNEASVKADPKVIDKETTPSKPDAV